MRSCDGGVGGRLNNNRGIMPSTDAGQGRGKMLIGSKLGVQYGSKYCHIMAETVYLDVEQS